MITKDTFGPYDRYTLRNEYLEASFITLGATMTSLKFKGKDCVLSYATPEEYTADVGNYLCVTVGRYANRIGNSEFTLNGKTYSLPANEGKNILHGGPAAFHKRLWAADADDESVTFTIDSADGDNGFPGNLTAGVRFSLDGAALRVEFTGRTDAPTVFAPTVHPYFCFDGFENVMRAKMQLAATGHTEVDGGLIPTGVILPCEGRFDYAEGREISEDLDDCFITPGDFAGSVEMNGIRMEVWTDFPALQVYTSGSIGAPFKKNAAVALEPEAVPDSPNHANFPSTVLNPGEEYFKYAEYRFSEV